MRIFHAALWCSVWCLCGWLYGAIASSLVLYPLCQIPDGPLYKNTWLLYMQEYGKSAVMLWQADTHCITRVTSARFSPKKVQCSPHGGIISFLDDGIVWLRRISRRYTRPLETAFPIGTITDYAWYDAHHLIVTARKGADTSLYCVNLDGTVCGELCFCDTLINCISCFDTSLLCVIRDNNSYSNMLMQLHIDADTHPIRFCVRGVLWTTDDSLLVCKHMTAATAYCVSIPINVLQNQSKKSDLCGSLYYLDYTQDVLAVRRLIELPLHGLGFFNDPDQIIRWYAEGALPVMPTVGPEKTKLAIPVVSRRWASGAAMTTSRLVVFDCERNTMRTIAKQKGIAFLSPQWIPLGFQYGGMVEQLDYPVPEDMSESRECIMYSDYDDKCKVTLATVSCAISSVPM